MSTNDGVQEIVKGIGEIGKGFLGKLMEYTLDKFYDPLDIEYLCKTKHQSHSKSADPQMARKKNVRCVISTEPEGTAVLRTAKLKEITGRDTIQTRFLNKNCFNFEPKFKVFIQTNDEMIIKGDDQGMGRRFRCITFRKKFVDNPKLPHEAKIDRALKTVIKGVKYRIAFSHMLVKYYKKYVKDGLDMPKTFSDETKDYLNRYDPLKQFIENKLEVTNNRKDLISSSELYDEYLEYNGNDNKGIHRNNFKRKFQSKGFKFKRTKKGSGFTGIKMKKDDDHTPQYD